MAGKMSQGDGSVHHSNTGFPSTALRRWPESAPISCAMRNSAWTPAGAHEKLTHSEEAVLSAQVDDDSLLQEEACGLFWTLRLSTVESKSTYGSVGPCRRGGSCQVPFRQLSKFTQLGKHGQSGPRTCPPHLHTASTGRTADSDM